MRSNRKGDNELTARPGSRAPRHHAAKRHCKAVGYAGIPALSKRTELKPEAGVVDLLRSAGTTEFISAARTGRFWEREDER